MYISLPIIVNAILWYVLHMHAMVIVLFLEYQPCNMMKITFCLKYVEYKSSFSSRNHLTCWMLQAYVMCNYSVLTMDTLILKIALNAAVQMAGVELFVKILHWDRPVSEKKVYFISITRKYTIFNFWLFDKLLLVCWSIERRGNNRRQQPDNYANDAAI